jgi:hypothetical protein
VYKTLTKPGFLSGFLQNAKITALGIKEDFYFELKI